MKTITFEQLDHELKSIFGISDWCPISEEWGTITHEEIATMISLYPAQEWMEDYPCGWIARGFAVDVARHYADGRGGIKAVGVAHGTMINGTPNHTVNVYHAPDGLYLLDMQTGERWLVNERPAEIYFVEM